LGSVSSADVNPATTFLPILHPGLTKGILQESSLARFR
jgi:hypothetical protein